MLREVEWFSEKLILSLEDYMENVYVLFVLGFIVFLVIYLIGLLLFDEIVGSFEYNQFYKFMSIMGCFLNDI